MFERNEEIDAYIESRGKVILNACPGSGKTTSIAFKLQSLIKEVEKKYNKFSGVACLSFTNIAKDEINNKFKSFSGNSIKYPHIVSTIDSFINQYIVLPNYHLLVKQIKRPKILDNSNDLDDIWRNKWNRKFKMKNGKHIHFSYPPSTIDITLDENFLFNSNVPNYSNVKEETFNLYCSELKKWQFANGFLTNNDASFVAVELLKKHPRVGETVAKRYPLIILDEAQDTSEIHYAIFDRLIELGLDNIEIVGDPFQSLYEWREARPDLFLNKYTKTDSWNPLNYTYCRRSNKTIIDSYNIFRNDDIEINSSLATKNRPILIIKYLDNNEKDVIDYYLDFVKEFKHNQIVVRGKNLLNKILGFGSSKIEPWKSNIPSQLILAKRELSINDIKNSVNRIRKIIPKLIQPTLTYSEQKEIELEYKKDYKLNAKIFSFIKALPEFDLSLSDWTIQAQNKLHEVFELNQVPNFDLKQGTWRPKHNLSINQLFNFNEAVEKLPISTIHQVKGKTFDTLLLFLSRNSQGQNISLNDIYKPDGFPNEKQRMIYVAMSRPRHQLAIAIPIDIKNEKLKEYFGQDIIVKEIKITT